MIRSPIGTGRLIAAGRRVHLVVVLGNAAVQAATTLPALTPGSSIGFLALFAASLISLVVAIVVVVAQCQASAGSIAFRRPTLFQWACGLIAVMAVAGSAVIWPPLVLVTATLAMVVLPTANGGLSSLLRGFRAFVRLPARAIGLAVLTVLVLALLWLCALLSGFFITGALSAGLTWVVFGSAVVLLAGAWTSLVQRAERSDPR